MIWNKPYTVEEVNKIRSPLSDHFDIQVTSITDDSVTATMPINKNTHQPFGFLHGGVSVMLAESVGSIGATLTIDPETHSAFGIEVNANHVKAKRSGALKAVGKPVHIGGTTQVWAIDLFDEKESLVCTSRLTVAVRKRAK